MRLTPNSEEQDIPQWKQSLREQAQNLAKLRELVQKERNQEVLDWIETQPPAILDKSIGT